MTTTTNTYDIEFWLFHNGYDGVDDWMADSDYERDEEGLWCYPEDYPDENVAGLPVDPEETIMGAMEASGWFEPVESPSGWSYMPAQENGDEVGCWQCGGHLDDNLPVVNDRDGFAYHGFGACAAAAGVDTTI
jgi:hypothetical protein